jgi:hypothetical protein
LKRIVGGLEAFSCDVPAASGYDEDVGAHLHRHAHRHNRFVVMHSSSQHESQPAPSLAYGRAPRRPGRAGVITAALIGATCALIAACTLTSEDYAPNLVEVEPLAVDAGVVSEPIGCGEGIECCTAVPCPTGQLCSDGLCSAAPVGEVVDAGPVACEGNDCPGQVPPVPLAPSCDDAVQNGDETGSDCGGSCAETCAIDQGCSDDTDCAPGLTCFAETSRCSEPSCVDGALNGAETDRDCGGGCPGCPDDAPCSEGTDCASGVCGDGTCSAPTCGDGQQNQDETAVDCGGSCPQNCPNGGGCGVAGDCQSGVCDDAGCGEGVERCCQVPSCDDTVQNGGESDVDCGNAACGDCALGDRCQFGFQCQTNQCINGVCSSVPTCTDNVRNGTETGIDCGGTCPANCPDQSECTVAGDCINANCSGGICISCGDGFLNGTETGVDCGGADPACRRCNPTETCTSNTDCVNVFCLAGICS